MDVGPLASCVARIPSVAHLVPRHDHHILVTRLDLSSMGVASLAGWTIECSVCMVCRSKRISDTTSLRDPAV